MTGQQISEDLARQLATVLAPTQDYGNRRLGLTLDSIARQRQLEDIASQRQFISTETEKAAQRRTKEATDTEHRQFAAALAMMGITTTDKDGNLLAMPKLQSNLKDFQKNKATSMLSVYDKQMKDAVEQQRDLVDRIQHIPDAVGTAEQRRQALSAVLADPTATSDVPRGELDQLQKILAEGKDPGKAVQDVFEHMQDSNWFPWTRGRAQAKASRFYQSYLTQLSTRVDQSKQLSLMAYSQQLDDIGKQINGLAAQRDKHIIEFAPFLPKEDLDRTFSQTPPEDPNAVFANPAGESSPGRNTLIRDPNAATVTPNTRQPDVNPFDTSVAIGSSLGGSVAPQPAMNTVFTRAADVTKYGKMTKEEALRSRGLYIDNNGQLQSLASGGMTPWQTGSSMIPVPQKPGQFAAPPSPVDIQFALKVLHDPTVPWGNDKWKDRQWPKPAQGFSHDGRDEPVPATPDEIQAAYRLNIVKYGAPPDNRPLIQGLANGDDAAIKGFNLLIDEVRQRGARVNMPFNPMANDATAETLPVRPTDTAIKATPLGAVSPTPTIVPLTFMPQ